MSDVIGNAVHIIWIATDMLGFTRLTDGFSKKAENHAHMVALYPCSTVGGRFAQRCW